MKITPMRKGMARDWLLIAIALSFVVFSIMLLNSCGDSSPVALPAGASSNLTPEESHYFQHAEEFYGYSASEPTVNYTDNTRCSNGSMCCAAGCLPYSDQSCYWPSRNEIDLTRVSGGPDVCASVALKLATEFCNQVHYEATGSIEPDQYGQPCARSA